MGELLGADAMQNFLPDAQRIGRLPGVGENGIDDLYKVDSPNADYVIVEYKFGTSKLGNTIDGKQMSDNWSIGGTTGNNRILDSVGNDAVAQDIANSIDAGRVERWVVNTDPSGQVTVGLLDKDGNFIQQPASKLFKGVDP